MLRNEHIEHAEHSAAKGRLFYKKDESSSQDLYRNLIGTANPHDNLRKNVSRRPDFDTIRMYEPEFMRVTETNKRRDQMDEITATSSVSQPNVGLQRKTAEAIMRGGALVVGVFAAFLTIMDYASSSVFIHPMVGLLLVIGSVGFFAMSYLDP